MMVARCAKVEEYVLSVYQMHFILTLQPAGVRPVIFRCLIARHAKIKHIVLPVIPISTSPITKENVSSATVQLISMDVSPALMLALVSPA